MSQFAFVVTLVLTITAGIVVIGCLLLYLHDGINRLVNALLKAFKSADAKECKIRV